MSLVKKRLLADILSLAQSHADDVTVVGIDGPTASGKTTLANALADDLSEKGYPVWIYRVDWALAGRAERVRDLGHLRAQDRQFAFEGELHMRLHIVEDFLLQVRRYREGRQLSFPPSKKKTETTTLQSLYDRENGGVLAGTASVTLQPGMIILVEGHYTLRNTLDRLIDLNVVLLAEPEELLRRKKDRVKGYRGAEEAEDYFWRIDVPSFKQHLKRFGFNAHLVIENTHFEEQQLQDLRMLLQWGSEDTVLPQARQLQFSDFGQGLFGASLMVDETLAKIVDRLLATVVAWDKIVATYIRQSVQELKEDLGGQTGALIQALNGDIKGSGFQVKLAYSDALYNVYFRKLPLAIGLSLVDDQGEVLAVTAEVFHTHLMVQFFWAGGHRQVRLDRMLGAISKAAQDDQTLTDVTPSGRILATDLTVYLPTAFTVPSFLKGRDYRPVFIGKEGETLTASQAIDFLMENGGVWIHRFALFSEKRFFTYIMDCCGIAHVSVGNYVIAIRHDDMDFLDRFRDFCLVWRRPILRDGVFTRAEDDMDALILAERANVVDLLAKSGDSFQLRDGYLFSQFMYAEGEILDQALETLRQFLESDNRLLRKRATQFVQNYFPNIELESNAIWDDLPRDVVSHVMLDDYIALGPSILAELYLWLAIRDDAAAVLSANLYDIRVPSLDAKSILRAAAVRESPIVLQISLNACGQSEKDGKSVMRGYLNPKEGPEDFVAACLRAARDLFLSSGQDLPLYSLGLDHVNVEYDKPEGRAKRFLQRAVATGHITHVVLDGSAKFDAKSRTPNALMTEYQKVADYAADLIDDMPASYLLDREVCGGELSFIGDSQEAYIPTAAELRGFMWAYQDAVMKKDQAALLARPMLFIGNLGTTHHGADSGPPKSAASGGWRRALQSEHFVSAVLHGTTRSHRDVLSQATAGCHKVNIAGDLLQTFVRSMPQPLTDKIVKRGSEAKRAIADIRADLDAMSDAEITTIEHALHGHARELMATVNSPRLGKMDVQYFKYMSYLYEQKALDVIFDKIRDRIQRASRSQKAGTQRLAECPFSASMIEVPLLEMTQLTQYLWDQGIRHFHIDEGDGQFIPRSFSGVDKARHLRAHFPNVELHAHLMVENPHVAKGGDLPIIERYVQAGVDAIAVHPRAFDSRDYLLSALSLIRKLGCRPGIVIETMDRFDDSLQSIVEEVNLDWLIVMGVPIGYGGQLFQFSSLARIAAIADYAKASGRHIFIEVDGGLTFENIQLCQNAGGHLFAGWSIIKGRTLPDIGRHIDQINEILHVQSVR